MSRMSLVLTALPATFALEFEPGAFVVVELMSPDGRPDRFVPHGIDAPPGGPGPLRVLLSADAEGLDLLVLPPGRNGIASRFPHQLAVGRAVTLVVRDPLPRWGAPPRPGPAAPRPAPGGQHTGAQPLPRIAPPAQPACARHGISPPEACPLCR
jgi:hypothetical protein